MSFMRACVPTTIHRVAASVAVTATALAALAPASVLERVRELSKERYGVMGWINSTCESTSASQRLASSSQRFARAKSSCAVLTHLSFCAVDTGAGDAIVRAALTALGWFATTPPPVDARPVADVDADVVPNALAPPVASPSTNPSALESATDGSSEPLEPPEWSASLEPEVPQYIRFSSRSIANSTCIASIVSFLRLLVYLACLRLRARRWFSCRCRCSSKVRPASAPLRPRARFAAGAASLPWPLPPFPLLGPSSPSSSPPISSPLAASSNRLASSRSKSTPASEPSPQPSSPSPPEPEPEPKYIP
mmetsp:Transcript_4536/g.9797  ORF Transcript_4536/g.9797 Transcript_4536/m.9797 type:complete len:308 (-) Transcript_4536:54-977(-)